MYILKYKDSLFGVYREPLTSIEPFQCTKGC